MGGFRRGGEVGEDHTSGFWNLTNPFREWWIGAGDG